MKKFRVTVIVENFTEDEKHVTHAPLSVTFGQARGHEYRTTNELNNVCNGERITREFVQGPNDDRNNWGSRFITVEVK